MAQQHRNLMATLHKRECFVENAALCPINLAGRLDDVKDVHRATESARNLSRLSGVSAEPLGFCAFGFCAVNMALALFQIGANFVEPGQKQSVTGLHDRLRQGLSGTVEVASHRQNLRVGDADFGAFVDAARLRPGLSRARAFVRAAALPRVHR